MNADEHKGAIELTKSVLRHDRSFGIIITNQLVHAPHQSFLWK